MSKKLQVLGRISGEDGATFTPAVSEDGTLSWTNNKGLANPAPVNIKGKDGKPGADGQDGKTPVRGTDYWTEADKVEIVGDVLEQVGDIELPTGGGAEWKQLCDITIPQEDAAVTLFLDKDSNGNAFSCEEVSIKWVGIAVTDGTQSGKAWISINPAKAGYNQGKLGYQTNDYFYYTAQANYSRSNILQIKPCGLVAIENTKMWLTTGDESDIHALEISGYQNKAFYGRVIVYGR